MINARELRIGNWVNYDGVPFEIGWHTISEVACSKTGIDPIPLTPQILEETGFEKTIHFIGELKLEYIDYRSDGFVLFYLPEGLVEVEFWNKAIETINDRHYIGAWQSLHQLQNLYWCLVGKELEIKL